MGRGGFPLRLRARTPSSKQAFVGDDTRHSIRASRIDSKSNRNRSEQAHIKNPGRRFQIREIFTLDHADNLQLGKPSTIPFRGLKRKARLEQIQLRDPSPKNIKSSCSSRHKSGLDAPCFHEGIARGDRSLLAFFSTDNFSLLSDAMPEFEYFTL